MDMAIEIHNTTLRGLLDEFAGHEIRNEGDSFTLAFHDALDAVKYCLKAQERLLSVTWPIPLMTHELCKPVTVGDVTRQAHAAGKGVNVLAGLRVRMGINTGVPEDIFLHDVTEHVDYRGLEYDLAGEICDLAAGGQILMGPRTYQRWNKVVRDAPATEAVAAALAPDSSVNSFSNMSQQWRGSMTRTSTMDPIFQGLGFQGGSLTGPSPSFLDAGASVLTDKSASRLFQPSVSQQSIQMMATTQQQQQVLASSQQPHAGSVPAGVTFGSITQIRSGEASNRNSRGSRNTLGTSFQSNSMMAPDSHRGFGSSFQSTSLGYEMTRNTYGSSVPSGSFAQPSLFSEGGGEGSRDRLIPKLMSAVMNIRKPQMLHVNSSSSFGIASRAQSVRRSQVSEDFSSSEIGSLQFPSSMPRYLSQTLRMSVENAEEVNSPLPGKFRSFHVPSRTRLGTSLSSQDGGGGSSLRYPQQDRRGGRSEGEHVSLALGGLPSTLNTGDREGVVVRRGRGVGEAGGLEGPQVRSSGGGGVQNMYSSVHASDVGSETITQAMATALSESHRNVSLSRWGSAPANNQPSTAATNLPPSAVPTVFEVTTRINDSGEKMKKQNTNVVWRQLSSPLTHNPGGKQNGMNGDFCEGASRATSGEIYRI
ncbi:hypothetical protein CEUSTIGMA_g8967.t1 [Chlamydomonas eustigma]|uniref:Guanylate cyclase domain-containing protein n=1 Tax=Chlamydomonas eustigma TaxID=1157962 RepID=A0A250XF49_9CHLO|nr:hypothetical protein CEUSTIGMA_g8967.t1 [Chlamydomonas eustigma]|eukprot:GAX81539.1 hypothetical protein CEUSTIGMA_g8967.t1 [Chlamydomonas eustigma]